MQPTTLVGRRREADALLSAAASAEAGRGSIVFLSGQSGSGKTFLLAETLARGESAKRQAAVSVRCYEPNAGNPLGPFREILKVLTATRRGRRAQRALELIREVAPDVLGLIPGIGTAAALGVKAAANVGVFAVGESHEARQAEVASDVAAVFKRIADEALLVVTIDSAQWIDASSTEVLARLAESIEATRLLIVVAYDDDGVDYRHPLLRVRSKTLAHPGVTAMRLEPFALEDVAELLRIQYGGLEAEGLAEWLLDRTEGSPLFIREYLRSLEHQTVLQETAGRWQLRATIEGSAGNWRLGGALAHSETPETLLEALRPRVADLGDDERALLENGAIQGRRFLSSVLVSVLGADEDEILERLSRLEEHRHMITLEDIEDWWSDRSDLYAFAPGVLQELFYSGLAQSRYRRRKLHRAVANALESVIARDMPPPRHALLEIAGQYEAAGDYALAAARYVDVAESTFAEGADRETAATARHAVDLLHRAREGESASDEQLETYGLLARAATLALVGGEASWYVEPPEDAGESILRLAEEAIESAEAVGDVALRASAHYAAGLAFLAYRGLQEGIAEYGAALELAQEAEEPVAEFAILTNLAHQVGSEDLHKGWAHLESARNLLTRGALDGRISAAAVALERVRLDMRLGVAQFDLGRYGEALDLLRAAVEALRNSGRRDDAGWAMSFLGQLYTSIGLYEAAEGLLREGISLFQDDRSSLGLRSYLRSLLGRAYLEWEPSRRSSAWDELQGAREESAESGFRPTAPLVEASYAEFLIAEGTRDSLRKAEELLAECPTYGWPRSEIAVRHGRARIAVAEDRLADALAFSSEAVEVLQARRGTVTATRAEEILLTHSQILERTHSSEASSFATQAAEVVRAKARSLADPAQRQSYLTRVEVTRAVLAAARRNAEAAPS
jgi:tetratricopeptide (TPR) repeat protein